MFANTQSDIGSIFRREMFQWATNSMATGAKSAQNQAIASDWSTINWSLILRLGLAVVRE